MSDNEEEADEELIAQEVIDLHVSQVLAAHEAEQAIQTQLNEIQIKKGNALLDAKKELRREFGRQFSDHPDGPGPIPFGISTAQRYMKIAKDPVLGNTAYMRYLPSSLNAKYILAGIKDATKKEELVKSGAIHPDLTEEDAKALREGKKSKAEPKDDGGFSDLANLLLDLPKAIYRTGAKDMEPEELAKRILEKVDVTLRSRLLDERKLKQFDDIPDLLRKLYAAIGEEARKCNAKKPSERMAA